MGGRVISANRVDEAAVAQDVQHDSSAADLQPEEVQPENVALVRYGLIPQVARFGLSDELKLQLEAGERRGLKLVVTSDRGVEVADLLEIVRKGIITTDNPVTGEVQRIATDADLATHAENRKRAELEFFDWQQRVSDWQLQLQIIDVEWTLEADQVVLYVLNGQDAETTRLALLAAAAGHGIVHVQPVAASGIVQASGGGGCGSGGGGCGSGGCGH